MPDKVLIIDDERAIAQLTALWVRQAGHSPILAFDGVRGLASMIRGPSLVSQSVTG